MGREWLSCKICDHLWECYDSNNEMFLTCPKCWNWTQEEKDRSRIETQVKKQRLLDHLRKLHMDN